METDDTNKAGYKERHRVLSVVLAAFDMQYLLGDWYPSLKGKSADAIACILIDCLGARELVHATREREDGEI